MTESEIIYTNDTKYLLTDYNSNYTINFGNQETPIIKIEMTGKIYWLGREVETDDDFKNVVIEMLTLMTKGTT
jgi:hypothetical protein